ncbi:hypothetical protein QBC35DRAFT_410032, partial [Podospora australis]
MDNDVPDYKPLSLRRSFLVILLLFLCGLITILEYLFRTLPHEDGRTKIPQDFEYVPAEKRHEHAPYPHPTATPLPRLQRDERGGYTTTVSAPGIEVTRRANMMVADPRPPTSAYANTDPITTYVTWADTWYGDARNPFSRTAVYAGQDAPDACLYRYQGLIMTSNSSGCYAMIVPDNTETRWEDPPPGWKKATWILYTIWFPVGGGCDTKYDDWYAGYPSNLECLIKQDGRFHKNQTCQDEQYQAPWQCTWYQDRGKTREATATSSDSQPVGAGRPQLQSSGGSVLLIYFGLFLRTAEGGIDWAEISAAHWPGSRYVTPQYQQYMDPFGNYYGIELGTTSTHLTGTPEQTSPSIRLNSTTTSSTLGNSRKGSVEVTHSRDQESTSSKLETEKLDTVTAGPSRSPVISSERQVNPTQESHGPVTVIPSISSQEMSAPVTSVHTLVLDHVTLPSSIETSHPKSSIQNEGTTPNMLSSSPSSSLTTQAKQPSKVNPSIKLLASEEIPQLPTSVRYVQVIVTQRIQVASYLTLSNTVETSFVLLETPIKVLIGVPVRMVTPRLTTITNADGAPTTTLTDFGGDVVLTTALTTLTLTIRPSGLPKSSGQAEMGVTTKTTVMTTEIPITSIVRTHLDDHGIPTATVTLFPVFPRLPNATEIHLMVPKKSTYFVVYFLPVLLTAAILIPIQALDAELKQFLPFRLLTSPSPSAYSSPVSERRNTMTKGAEALRMVPGRRSGWRLLFRYRDPISLVSDAIVLCAAAVVSLAGETVGLKLRGSCALMNSRNCIVTVAVFPTPARVVEALLAVLVVLIFLLAWILGRWRTGVAAHPGSVAGICVLLQVSRTREALLQRLDAHDKISLKERLKGVDFRLRRLKNWTGRRAEDYGLAATVIQRSQAAESGKPTTNADNEMINFQRRSIRGMKSLPVRRMQFHVPRGERVFQVSFLLLLCGLLTLVLYYENTVFEDPSESTAFEWFMDSQGFGVRLLFTSVGVVVSFMWDHFFSTFSQKRPYQLMAQRPQPARGSFILTPRPLTVLAGLYHAFPLPPGLGTSRGSGDPLAAAIALAGILSKFLPALLSSVPFASAQTWQTHEICTWSVVSLLSVMICVLVGHMWLVKWPECLSDQDESLATRISYVFDSAMLRDFERMSLLGQKERDKRVVGMGRMYRFGWTVGTVTGERRVGVDYPEGEQGFRMRGMGVGSGFGRRG